MAKNLKKKITIGISIILLSFIVLVLITNFIEKKIGESIVDKANNNLLAKVQISGSTLSLFSNFPNITVSLHDINITGKNKFEADTLLQIKSIDISLGIGQLLNYNSDKFPEFSKITSNDVNIYLNVLRDGTFNWDILKPKDSIPFENKNILSELRIHEFTINHCSIVYNNKHLKTKAIVTDWSGSFSNKYSDNSVIVTANSTVEDIFYKVGDITYLSKVKGVTKTIIDVDFTKNNYTISENLMELNDLKIKNEGSVTVKEGDLLDLDLKFDSPNIQLKDILSLAYPIYTNDFKDLQSKGSVLFKGYIKGIMGDGKLPLFHSQLLIKDGMFKYPFLAKSVDNINIDMNISNQGYILDSIKIDVNRFDLSIGGSPITANLHLIRPQTDPTLSTNIMTDLDLSTIAEVYPLHKNTDIRGKVVTNINIVTKVSSIENKQYDNVKMKGLFKIDKLTFNSDSLPQLDINNIEVAFDPKSVNLSSSDMRIGESSLNIQGHFNNIVPYLLKSKQLVGQLNIKSDSIRVSDFRKHKETQVTELSMSSGLSTFNRYSIPANIDLQLNATVDKIIYKDLYLNNFQSRVSICDGKLNIYKLNVNALGGNVDLVASYFPLVDVKEQELSASLSIINGSMKETLKYIYANRESQDTISKISGNYSLNLSIKTFLGNGSNNFFEGLTGSGIFTSEEVQLQKIKMLDKLSSVLRMDGLKILSIRDINLPITIADNAIRTDSFNATIDAKGKLTLSGSASFDRSVDYKGSVTLLSDENTEIPITIKGTIKDPKIEVDAKGLLKNLMR